MKKWKKGKDVCRQTAKQILMHRQVAKKNGCFWWIFCYLLWLQYPAICFDLNISCYIVCLLVPNLSNGFRRGRSKCMLYFLCPMPEICVREIFFLKFAFYVANWGGVEPLWVFLRILPWHLMFFYLCKVLESVRTFCWCKMVQLGCPIVEDKKRNILIHDVIVNCATFRVLFFALFMGLKGEPKGAKEVILLTMCWPLAFE